MNNSGDIAFLGDLSPGPPNPTFEKLGVYGYSAGRPFAIAHPGLAMPGGGTFVTASFIVEENVSVNNRGEVAFTAKLDTDDNQDQLPDTGLYVWSNGELHLVVRSGTVLPGVGTIKEFSHGCNSHSASGVLRSQLRIGNE
jgi:hypothetical protein